MGSIVEKIDDILEEYGTWENYEKAFSRKNKQQPTMKKETNNICREFTNENKDGVHRWAIEIGRSHKQSFEPKFSKDNNPVLVLRDDDSDTEIQIGDWLIVTDNGIVPCRANKPKVRKPYFNINESN